MDIPYPNKLLSLLSYNRQIDEKHSYTIGEKLARVKPLRAQLLKKYLPFI
jgi:hypothetical protein